jgi:hypothetical protein
MSTKGCCLPDIYGQIHPNETSDLISQQLIAFHEEINKLPAATKGALQQAQTKCPELLNDEFYVMFLRSEVYNADVCMAQIVLFSVYKDITRRHGCELS